MRTQLAAYRGEVCCLHHANDTLAESNRILLDAVATMNMEHAAEMQRLRGEMAPGFSWPDPDQSALVERYKTRVEELETEVRALKRRYVFELLLLRFRGGFVGDRPRLPAGQCRLERGEVSKISRIC